MAGSTALALALGAALALGDSAGGASAGVAFAGAATVGGITGAG